MIARHSDLPDGRTQVEYIDGDEREVIVYPDRRTASIESSMKMFPGTSRAWLESMHKPRRPVMVPRDEPSVLTLPVWERVAAHERRKASSGRVLEAYRLCEAYANPLRGKMPLSSTEVEACKRAAQLLRMPR